MSTVRDSFVAQFGEANAAAVESAAEGHKNGVHQGSDPFKWAILICVGHECLGKYAEGHGITADLTAVQDWAYIDGDLASHDGDCDFLALMCGAYQGWVNQDAMTVRYEQADA